MCPQCAYVPRQGCCSVDQMRLTCSVPFTRSRVLSGERLLYSGLYWDQIWQHEKRLLSSSIHTSCECRTKVCQCTCRARDSLYTYRPTYNSKISMVWYCSTCQCLIHIIVLLYSMLSMVWYGSTCQCLIHIIVLLYSIISMVWYGMVVPARVRLA